MDVTWVTLNQKHLMAVSFKELKKPLGLNCTNQATVVALYGTDWQKWIGKRLVLFKTSTLFQDKIVPCIRIKAPADYVCPFKPRTVARTPVE